VGIDEFRGEFDPETHLSQTDPASHFVGFTHRPQSDIVTRRIVRQLLVASLIALHAAIALCGPCLHELPGLGHDSSAGSQTQQHPLKSSHDSGDNCPVCHFLAQGQLPVTLSCRLPAPHAGAWIKPFSSSITIVPAEPLSRQRAPPIVQL
jgi:hypothetical protein